MKRLFDFSLALIGLLLLSPIIALLSFLIWLEDRHSPIYKAKRVGRHNKDFILYKFRSMRLEADKTGVFSTSANDTRITRIGSFIRRFKLDELPQLVNILNGTMSLVGPRPNVRVDVDKYTLKEFELLNVRPGITDFASIVFSDEGDILSDAEDPDKKYNQIIRPWKSRLGLIYIEKSNLALDLKLLFLTFIVILNRPAALKRINGILKELGAEQSLLEVVLRKKDLTPFPPPGSNEVAD